MIIKIEIPEELVTDEVIQMANIAAGRVKLYAKKNTDYGNSFDKGIDKYGVIYAITRLHDKLSRIENLTINNKNARAVSDESVIDTLLDLSCYSDMLVRYMKEHDNLVLDKEIFIEKPNIDIISKIKAFFSKLF